MTIILTLTLTLTLILITTTTMCAMFICVYILYILFILSLVSLVLRHAVVEPHEVKGLYHYYH